MESGEIQYDSRQKYIEELGNIRNQLHIFRVKRDYKLVYRWLECYFSALSSVMTDEQLKQHMFYYDECTNIDREHDNKVAQQETIMHSFFSVYFTWEILLKRVEGGLGLTVPRARNAGTAVSRGTF